MKRGILLIGLIFGSLAIVWGGQVPRPAPPLTVTTPDGAKLSISDFKGKVVLLKFFLTECPHCQRSAGNIMSVYRELRPKGLEVIGVAINPDAKTAIPDFARRFGVTYPLAMGDRLMVTTFADISAVTRFYVPYIFMIDRKGVIRYEHPGGDHAYYNNEVQNLKAELETLLKEPASARKASAQKSPPKS